MVNAYIPLVELFLEVHTSYDSRTRFIDCNDSEELFLAISALRDDDCYMQYYWFDGKLLKCKGTGSTVKMNGDYSIKLITLGQFLHRRYDR